MNMEIRILVIGLCLALALLIVELIRRRKLKEKYAILWLFSTIVVLMLAVFYNVLERLSMLLGIALPANAIFFFSIFFIILINIHFTTVISELSEQNKIISQKLTLLEFDLSNRKK